MTDFERYVLEEHVEDFNDGIINRRELLRRVTLMTGSLAATLTILETMGCGAQPSGTAATPQPRASSTPQPYATPPAQPDTTGVTVQPNDPRIKVETIKVTGSDGASLISYAARPAHSTAGGILVVHEAYYPGWVAEVDGQPARILRTNVLFRGVEVGEGRHRVVFRFEPFSLSNLRDALLALFGNSP